MRKRSRALRTRIRFRVEIRDSRRAFDAESRDISVDGLSLTSPILMTIGDRAGTSLHLEGTAPVSLSFEVRWARKDGEKAYLLGVEFVHTDESRKELQKLMWQIDSGTVKGVARAAGGPRRP